MGNEKIHDRDSYGSLRSIILPRRRAEGSDCAGIGCAEDCHYGTADPGKEDNDLNFYEEVRQRDEGEEQEAKSRDETAVRGSGKSELWNGRFPEVFRTVHSSLNNK
jgi:hypothetical protein